MFLQYWVLTVETWYWNKTEEEKRREDRKQNKEKMEDTSKTIAHQIGGLQNDALRFGLHGVKSDIVGSHPLESSLQSVISLSQFHVLIILPLPLSDLIIVFSTAFI